MNAFRFIVDQVSLLMVPLLFFAIVGYAMAKRVKAYEAFIAGGKEADIRKYRAKAAALAIDRATLFLGPQPLGRMAAAAGQAIEAIKVSDDTWLLSGQCAINPQPPAPRPIAGRTPSAAAAAKSW